MSILKYRVRLQKSAKCKNQIFRFKYLSCLWKGWADVLSSLDKWGLSYGQCWLSWIASLRHNRMEYERNEKRSIGRLLCQHHHFKRTRFGRLWANPPSNILAIREFVPPPACLRYFVLTWGRLIQSYTNAKIHMPTYCSLY